MPRAVGQSCLCLKGEGAEALTIVPQESGVQKGRDLCGLRKIIKAPCRDNSCFPTESPRNKSHGRPSLLGWTIRFLTSH